MLAVPCIPAVLLNCLICWKELLALTAPVEARAIDKLPGKDIEGSQVVVRKILAVQAAFHGRNVVQGLHIQTLFK